MPERLKQHSLALIGYLLVACIFSYPLITNFTTSVLGPMEDNVCWLWYTWWVKYSLAEGQSSLFFTDFVFYPNGVKLLLNFTFFKTIIAIPLQYLFDIIPVYNILSLLSYVLSGFGAYLLVQYLVGHAGIGFVSGLIYTLSPTHVWHLDHHLDVGTVETIPFFVFFLIKFYQTRKNKDLLLSGVFFVLTALSCWYYMVSLLYLLMIFWGYILFVKREEAVEIIKKTMIMLFGSFVALIPVLYPLISGSISGEYIVAPETLNCVTDLLAPFVPSAKHPLSGWLNLEAFYKKLPCFPWEINVFIGYTVLALAIYGLVKVKSDWNRFMALTGGFFWVMSLGKHLQWNGKIILETIYLPYFWLAQQLPFLNAMRSPARFMIMVMLALAVSYGYGLDFLIKYLVKKGKLSSSVQKRGLVVLAGLLVFLEFMSYPNTLLDLEETTQAHYLAGNLPGADGEYAVLELPLMNNYIYVQMQLYRQVRHRKKILNGHSSRLPVGVYDFINKGPLRILRDAPARANLGYFQSLKPFLVQNRIKYIILNRYMISDSRYINFIENSLRQTFTPHGIPNPKIGLYRVY